MNTRSSTTLIDGQEWVLVPKEPTEAMLAQVEPALDDYYNGNKSESYEEGGRQVYKAMLSAAPQPTGDAPTDRASPIQPYGPDDDENIFALLCARKDARTDTSAKAIAWAEDEIENLRSERNDLVTKVNAPSAERARVIEECAKVADQFDKNASETFATSHDIKMTRQTSRDIARAIRALGQQDTGGADHG